MLVFIISKLDIVKHAVLPVPDCACAITSLPSNIGQIDFL